MNYKKLTVVFIVFVLAGFWFTHSSFSLGYTVRPVLILISAAIAVPYLWMVLNNHDRLGAGYFFAFSSGSAGILVGAYALIETTYLFLKRKTEKAVANLSLVFSVYNVILFSGLFGF